MSDIDEYIKKQNEILLEISDFEKNSFTTLKEKIKRLREVTRPLVEAGYYPNKKLNDLSSIIREKLRPYKIPSIENRAGWFYDLFEESERNSKSDQMSQKISSLPIQQQTGNSIIDELKRVEKYEHETPTTKFAEYFNLIRDNTNEINKQATSILDKYGSSLAYITEFNKTFPDVKELEREIQSVTGKKKKELQERYDVFKNAENTIYNIENTIDNVLEKIQEQLEIKADNKFTSKQLDERNKITFIEKWKAILCNKLDGLGVSAIAKRLSIDKKHCTNNINPTNNPVTGTRNKHHDYINWFRALPWVCPCGRKNVADVKDYFDKQIERGKLDLPFEDLVLINTRTKE